MDETVSNTALISLGRIEARLDAMAEKENKTGDRLDRVEAVLADQNVKFTRLEGVVGEIKNNQKPKTPWWLVLGGVAATITALLGFWTLFNVAVDLSVVGQ